MNGVAAALWPHERLLVLCSLSCTQEARHQAIDALLSHKSVEVDWQEFIRQSLRHGIAPQAAVHLRGFAHDHRLPAPVFDCLDRMYRGNRHRNAVIFWETARLLQALQAQGIRCLVLKGVALSLTVYEEPGQRNFADVDILVDAENLAAAGDIAVRCGFAPEEGRPHPKQIHVAYTARCSEDILSATLAPEFDPAITPAMIAPHTHSVKVEIHQNLFRRTNRFYMRDVDMQPFWEGAQTTHLPDGTPIQVPSPEAMAVHLCEHAAGHGYSRLIFPLDMGRLLEESGNRFRWERMSAIALQSGLTEEVARMVSLLEREFGVSVPPAALADLAGRSGQSPSLPLTVEQVMQASRLNERERLWQRISEGRGAGAFLGTCWEMLIPSRHYMEVTYGVQPPLSMALLYCGRPVRLAAGLTAVMVRRLRKRHQTRSTKRESQA